jgi:hypothetical protein
LSASPSPLFCPRVAESGQHFRKTGPAIERAANCSLQQKDAATNSVCGRQPRSHSTPGQQAMGHAWCYCRSVGRSRQTPRLLDQNPSWPRISTQSTFSPPSRPNVSSTCQSSEWFCVTPPGARPAEPGGSDSATGIAAVTAATSPICVRPPT